MSRKHFQAIADVIRMASLSHDDKWTLAHQMARGIAGFNPNFDTIRFVAACLKDEDL